MFTLTLLHVVYSGCERTKVLVLSCLAVVFHLEKHFEASQKGGARVYLQLQDCDVRHLDVEREFRIPARVESVVFDRLRCWLRVPLEILIVTSQDYLDNYNFHLETFLLALKLMDKLDNVHMKLMMIDSGCTTVNI